MTSPVGYWLSLTQPRQSGPDGVALRHQPRPRPGQLLVQMDLDEELQNLSALALVRDYEVDVDTSSGTLKRRLT